MKRLSKFIIPLVMFCVTAMLAVPSFVQAGLVFGHEVHYYNEDGTWYWNETVSTGEYVTPPVDPVKDGYTFDGWYNRDGVYFDMTQPVTTNWYVYPKFIQDYVPEPTFTVTYLPGERGLFDMLIFYDVVSGSVTPVPDESFLLTGQEGWIFTGWSPTISEFVIEDINYVAQWEAVEEPPVIIPPEEPVVPEEPAIVEQPHYNYSQELPRTSDSLLATIGEIVCGVLLGVVLYTIAYFWFLFIRDVVIERKVKRGHRD